MTKISSKLFCKDCNKELRRLSPKGKLYSYCAKCEVKRSNEWRKNHPDCRKKEYHNGNGKYKTWISGLKQYGITEQDWQRMYDEQNGVCAICGKHQVYRRLSVDHCHKTGKVRGLLCVRCNRALGYVFDSPNILRNAANYLERTK